MGSYFVSVPFYVCWFHIICWQRSISYSDSQKIILNDIFSYRSFTLLQSWLRVSQRFHTLNQVAVGAVLGFCFSIFWFWLWDALLIKAFIAHFWVRVVGAAGSCVGFLLYVVWKWAHDNKHWFLIYYSVCEYRLIRITQIIHIVIDK